MTAPLKRFYVITGHTRGVGKELCRLLLEAGEEIVGISRNTLNENSGMPFQKISSQITLDFSSRKEKEFSGQLNKLPENLKKAGELIFVLNAAQNAHNTSSTLTFLDDFCTLIDINFTNQIRLLKILVEYLKPANVKCICIGSYASYTNKNKGSIGYVLSKTLALSSAINFPDGEMHNLHFQAIVFGGIDTEMYKEFGPKENKNQFRIVPMLRKKFQAPPEKAAKHILRAIVSGKRLTFYPSLPGILIILKYHLRNLVFSVVAILKS